MGTLVKLLLFRIFDKNIIFAAHLIDHVLDPTELHSHCNAYLSPQKTPSTWAHVPDFSLTGSGKVQKFAIREKYLQGKYGKVLI